MILKALLEAHAFTQCNAVSVKKLSEITGITRPEIQFLACQLAAPGFAILEGSVPAGQESEIKKLYIETDPDRLQNFAFHLKADGLLARGRSAFLRQHYDAMREARHPWTNGRIVETDPPASSGAASPTCNGRVGAGHTAEAASQGEERTPRHARGMDREREPVPYAIAAARVLAALHKAKAYSPNSCVAPHTLAESTGLRVEELVEAAKAIRTSQYAVLVKRYPLCDGVGFYLASGAYVEDYAERLREQARDVQAAAREFDALAKSMDPCDGVAP